VTYRVDGQSHEIAWRTSSPAATAFTGISRKKCAGAPITEQRACLSARLARHSLRHAAGLRRVDLRAPPARLLRCCSMRTPTRSRYSLQCSLAEDIDAWPASASGGAAGRGSTTKRAEAPRHRGVDREEHRAAAQLRRRADALRPAVPSPATPPHRAADRRQRPQSCGQRRALPGAGAGRAPTPRNRTAASTTIPLAAGAGVEGRNASPGG